MTIAGIDFLPMLYYAFVQYNYEMIQGATEKEYRNALYLLKTFTFYVVPSTKIQSHDLRGIEYFICLIECF